MIANDKRNPLMRGNLLDDGGPVVLRPREAHPATVEEVPVQPAPSPVPPKPPAPVEIPNAMAPCLAGESIRVTGRNFKANIVNARIRRNRERYYIEGRTDTEGALAIRVGLGEMVDVPFLGKDGKTVVVPLYVEAISLSHFPRVRDGMDVELCLRWSAPAT